MEMTYATTDLENPNFTGKTRCSRIKYQTCTKFIAGKNPFSIGHDRISSQNCHQNPFLNTQQQCIASQWPHLSSCWPRKQLFQQ